MSTGVVTTITTDWRGDTIVSLALGGGGTVLTVASVIDFDEDGGWLVLGDSDPFAYTTVDEEANTIQLVDAIDIGSSYEAGLPVIVWDPTVGTTGAQVVEYVATVEMHDGTGTPDATIPHELIPLSGVTALEGATVSIDQNSAGDVVIDRVLGRQARLEGAFIAMPIQTAEDGKRVVVTSENNGAVLFYTGSDDEADLGAGYLTTSETAFGSTVILQTAIAGPKLVGASGQPTIGLTSQNTSGAYTTYVAINADRLTLNGDRVEAPNMFVTAAPTTGGAANVNIGPGGQLRESTSSERFKVDLEPANIDPAAVLDLVVQTWRDKGEVEADPDSTARYIGVTAEQLHDLGLTEFVRYDAERLPYAVDYDRLFAAVLVVAQDHERRLQAAGL